MKQSALASAFAAAMGITALGAHSMAYAAALSADWTGYFSMLDPTGAVLANNSGAPRGTNLFVTPVSGTLTIDIATGAGSATLAPFEFLDNPQPLQVTAFQLQTIGDGMGGGGTLMLGNLLFDWGGNIGIPVSLVLNAAGLIAGEYAPGGVYSAAPALDGTFAQEGLPGTVTGPGGYGGYIGLGPMPIVTTAWNTSFAPNCSADNCMGVIPSGALPLVLDVATNLGYDGPNTGGSIGGSPMADGPFIGYNINIEFANLDNVVIDDFCNDLPSLDSCPPPPPVPIPATAWLFGSGLLGLLGVVRQRRRS